MEYKYRSPLQDEEYYKCERAPNSSEHFRSGPPSQGYPSSDPGPSRCPPMSRQHGLKSSPYSRPATSSQGPKYSNRYQLDSYPRELNDQMGALECKLCAVEMSSPIVAKMHYSGKPHMKKVKKFLIEWSMKTGSPLPDVGIQVSTTSSHDLAEYCELCDVRLLTTNDKVAHYTGKTHRKNERDPTNAKQKSKSYNTIDLSATDARFGIGAGFSTADSNELVAENIKVNDFVCKVCDVKAVSQDQLNIHLNGKKHQEKVRKKEAGVPKPDRPYKCHICEIAFDQRSFLQLHYDGRPHAKALKKLEQESEGRMCKLCDIKFSSDKHYEMHVNGERHKKKCIQNPLRDLGTAEDQKETTRACLAICGQNNNLHDGSFENIEIKSEYKNNFNCIACNMKFENEEKYEKHKTTRRHLLRTLDTEADKIVEDEIHWYCFTCREQYHSAKEFCQHLFEHKHMTLSNENIDLGSKVDLWHCNLCSLVMDQQAKDKHVTSLEHLLEAARADVTKMLTALATEELGTHKFHCTHCDRRFFNFIAFYEHMTSRQHLAEIVSAKLK